MSGLSRPPYGHGGCHAAAHYCGNKIFCGWICPWDVAGSGFPAHKGISKIKCSFFTTNAVRALLLLLFIILLISQDINIYDFFNPLKSSLQFTLPLLVIISLVLAASLLLYRPFCICLPRRPSHLIFERTSLFAVRKMKNGARTAGVASKQAPAAP